MKGYRTVLTGAALVVGPPLLEYAAKVDWTQFVSPNAAVAISGVLMILLRIATTSAVFKK